jgi:hypothetical protein
MRNNRESLILFVLIIFLIVKNYQSDSSSYKFTAELNHWKRNNYAREDIEEPFNVFEKEGGSISDSKTSRNTFARFFKNSKEENNVEENFAENVEENVVKV